MTIRQVKCPKCSSFSVNVVAVHNPETTDLNAVATLKCADCGHEWEGSTASGHYQKMRDQGRFI